VSAAGKKRRSMATIVCADWTPRATRLSSYSVRASENIREPFLIS